MISAVLDRFIDSCKFIHIGRRTCNLDRSVCLHWIPLYIFQMITKKQVTKCAHTFVVEKLTIFKNAPSILKIETTVFSSIYYFLIQVIAEKELSEKSTLEDVQ